MLHAPVWSSGMTLPLDTRWSVVRIGPWQKFARRSAAPSFALLCLCIPHFGLHAHLCCMCGEKWERLRCASQAHGPRALSPAPAMHMASVEPGSHPHSSPARQDEGPGLSRLHGATPRLSPVRGSLGRHHAHAHAPRQRCCTDTGPLPRDSVRSRARGSFQGGQGSGLTPSGGHLSGGQG